MTTARSFIGGIWESTKPRLSFMVVLTVLAAAAVAPKSLGQVNAWLLLAAASYAIVGAANLFNCVLERDVDAFMERTRSRPLVTGAISVTGASIAASFLFLLGFVGLCSLSPLSAVWGVVGFGLYVLAYTPLKRSSAWALVVGAIPGAVPPLMGWSATQSSLGAGAVILFLILFFWQMPHFIAISLRRETDYFNAGLKTVAGWVGRDRAERQMLYATALLLVVGTGPLFFGLAGLSYLILSAALVVGFAALCLLRFFKLRPIDWSRVVFLGSLAYLPAVLGCWILDQWMVRVGF